MKFSKLSQLFLVSSIGLIVAALLTACQLVTIDYVFVAASAGTSAGSAGQIYTYAVDSESGALRTGAPTISSGGTGPGGYGRHLGLREPLRRQPGKQFGGPLRHCRQRRSDPEGLDHPGRGSGIAWRSTPPARTCTWFTWYRRHHQLRTLTEYALSSGAIGSRDGDGDPHASGLTPTTPLCPPASSCLPTAMRFM